VEDPIQPGPVYAFSHRESVEAESGSPFSMDPDFQLTGPVKHGGVPTETAPLFFTTREAAERLRNRLNRMDLVPVVFRDAADCLKHLLHFQAAGYRWAIFDRGSDNERFAPLDIFIEVVRRDL
jgi:hypothetical protein